ncbi:conserved hypothetical protein [Luminiphilus syltensis NOR5-1B]|uniref:DUF1156 domain-containing protein n=1 Tax=Luminiphilus syltensis NOR5-1B TaxID=565045 RepID=B8KTC5_9GAMM|nr:DUF1156 domain-containing protein [Luminiphilus syltensis]EED36335.1 conserved hypothetical protein [Luminiphilus syltensis NOR5-1B]
MAEIKAPKKLIEVALPLDDINVASTRENYIYKGNPSAIHKWWAQRPIAAARAVLFAQMVNDPGGERGWYTGKSKQQADKEREELFDIIRELVKWENNNNEDLLNRAWQKIKNSWAETCRLNAGKPGFEESILPEFLDPFAGGGTLPLEAKRLGLRSNATDLNPIPVMINRALLQIPDIFKNREPISVKFERSEPEQLDSASDWSGVKGLARDVEYFGQDLLARAQASIGRYYPSIPVTETLINENPHLTGLAGQTLKVIAYMWARTVKSPNPAFNDVDVPLITSYMLSTKSGGEVYLEPIVGSRKFHFKVVTEKPKDITKAKMGTKLARGANFQCLLSEVPISSEYVQQQSKAGNLGYRMLAIAVEGPTGRTYISATYEAESLAKSAEPTWRPEVPFSGTSRYLGVKLFGMENISAIFTDRQTLALETFTGLVPEIFEISHQAAIEAGLSDDANSLEDGGRGAKAYAEAICLLLAFAIDKYSIYGNTLVTWYTKENRPSMLFSQNALPMAWDFIELNPFTNVGGGLSKSIKIVVDVVRELPRLGSAGVISQRSATEEHVVINPVISTDPPYYDNVPYSDLSDFFYVWMRRSLKTFFPKTFSTITTPKEAELVAFSHRHEDQNSAEAFFMHGMTKAMEKIANNSHPAYPVTIYYAFKQSDTKNYETASKGWETFLDAVLAAGLTITGTWPLRTERQGRTRSNQSNALASSIILVCHKKDDSASDISRREFQRELKTEMPLMLLAMTGGTTGQSPIAPVDLAQAAIGPGMAIFSKYGAVLNQDGSRMSVHDALILINRAITEHLSPESGNFDPDTQFCSSWFDQYGWSIGPFGEANVLAQAKGTTVDGVRIAGVVESGGGKVRLLKWSEYEADWDPTTDNRTPVWEACHQMIRSLNNQGESAAGELLAKMPEKGEPIRQLAYHLYTLCERKKWAEDARAYNELIGSWHAIVTASHEVGHSGSQAELGLDF